jgi:hypothetical protein
MDAIFLILFRKTKNNGIHSKYFLAASAANGCRPAECSFRGCVKSRLGAVLFFEKVAGLRPAEPPSRKPGGREDIGVQVHDRKRRCA